MDFVATVNLHLKTMKQKEYSEFITTIDTKNVIVIMPNGTKVAGEKNILKLHKEWFSEFDWQINYKILIQKEIDKMGYALIDVEYKDKNEDGCDYILKYYLNLIFVKNKNAWKLVHDQNTIHK